MLVLAIAGWHARAHLRRLALPLGAAALATAVVGGRSYVRNLLEHGSPFWPFIDTSWGDPIPPYIARFDVSFLDRPRATLEGRVGEYLDFLGGAPLDAGLRDRSRPCVVRRRAVVASAAATAVGALIWARSPFTGRSDFSRLFDFSLTTTRYLLPVFAAAALTLGAGHPRRAPAETAWRSGRSRSRAPGACRPRSTSAIRGRPRPAFFWRAVVVGAAGGLLAGCAPKPTPAALRRLGAAAAVGFALLLAVTAPGFLERYAGTGNFGSPVVSWLDSPARLPRGLAAGLLRARADRRRWPVPSWSTGSR